MTTLYLVLAVVALGGATAYLTVAKVKTAIKHKQEVSELKNALEQSRKQREEELRIYEELKKKQSTYHTGDAGADFDASISVLRNNTGKPS